MRGFDVSFVCMCVCSSQLSVSVNIYSSLAKKWYGEETGFFVYKNAVKYQLYIKYWLFHVHLRDGLWELRPLFIRKKRKVDDFIKCVGHFQLIQKRYTRTHINRANMGRIGATHKGFITLWTLNTHTYKHIYAYTNAHTNLTNTHRQTDTHIHTL